MSMCRRTYYTLTATILLVALGSTMAAGPDRPRHFADLEPAPFWMDIFGSLTVDGEPAGVGDEVAVYDAKGQLCGATRVHKEGLYGFMHVYADVPQTEDTDEGAAANDVLTFILWRKSTGEELPLTPVKKDLVVRFNLAAERQRVDLKTDH